MDGCVGKPKLYTGTLTVGSAVFNVGYLELMLVSSKQVTALDKQPSKPPPNRCLGLSLGQNLTAPR